MSEEVQQVAPAEEPVPFDPMDNEAVNKAADVFEKSIPRIKALARNMKGGSLYRVFSATMEFPLADKEPKFRSQAENELFILCLSATMARSTMLQAIAAEEARKRKLEEQVAQETINPVTDNVIVNKEETNVNS